MSFKIANNEILVSTTLPVMEMFYSLQGEGYYSGRPAVFIRLGGCDVGCHWCDVKESWDANAHDKLTIDEISSFIAETNCDFVVITGGEPAMYDLSALTRLIKNQGCEIAIETSGVYPLKGEFDWVCFSPKKFKKPVEKIYDIADELKVIIYNKSDFLWAEEHALKVKDDCKLYLQVEWSKRDQLSEEMIKYAKEKIAWRISVQTHKYLGIP